MLVGNIANPDDGGPYSREYIPNTISVGFQTVSELLDREGDQRNSWGEKNENARDTLITCIDGNIGM